ncbi:hypothetical protein D3C77_273000 [compost metagenome]
MELWEKELLQRMPVHIVQSVLKHKKRGTWISFAQNCSDGGVMLPRDWGGNKLQSEELESWLYTWISTQYSDNISPDGILLCSSLESAWRQLLDHYVEPDDDVWAVHPLSAELIRLLKEREVNIIGIESSVSLLSLTEQYDLKAPACIVLSGSVEEKWGQEEGIGQFIVSQGIKVFVDQTNSFQRCSCGHSSNVYHIHSLQKLWFPDISIAWITGEVSQLTQQGRGRDSNSHKQGQIAAQRLHYIVSDPLFSWHTHTLQIEDIYRARYQLMSALLETSVWSQCIADVSMVQKDGIYIWIPLQEELKARHVLRASLLQGVDFWISNDWSSGQSGQYEWIRLNYAAYPEAILKKGISILQEVLGDFTARLG